MSAPLPTNQRMFHGAIRAEALSDQLAARFNSRQRRVKIEHHGDTATVQIGSQHGTPITIHIADLPGGVMVTMSADRDWLDKAGDVSELMFRRASEGNVLGLLGLLPDLIGELSQENMAPQIWNAVNDICALTRSLAGEENAPKNPKVCWYCNVPNPDSEERCLACGAPLPSILPRVCPKCGRAHTSDALFCQACGTRLVEG